MIDRRSVFSAAASVTTALAWVLGTNKASAAEPKTAAKKAAKKGAWSAAKNPAPAFSFGDVERLPNADVAGQMDFHAGFLGWSLRDFDKTSSKRLLEILAENGVDPEANVPLEPYLDEIKADPIMAARMRTWLSNQQLMLGGLEDAYESYADQYLTEMEAAEAKYPNRIELNPDMYMPDYAKHEVHLQPGGYVGNAFAGFMNYHYGNVLYEAMFGSNIQDQRIVQMANAVPLPDDGKVERALDMGCGTGRLAFGLKHRFPDAAVTGIDIAGPMVRFSHKRGVDIGLDVFFAQRSAEETKFPDNHFDVIASNILHHEVTAQATDNIVKEAFRVLRPGGVFYPIDHATGKQAPKHNAAHNYWVINDRAINNEVWRNAFEARDFADVVRKAGFKVDESLPPAVWGTGSIKAVKPA